MIHIHVTHEAVHKVGGIGAVLQGLVTAASYRAAVNRVMLVGPLVDRHRADPLGPDGIVLYDNWQGIWSDEYGSALQAIEVARGVRVVYGRRPFKCADGTIVEPEVLLVDVESSVPHGLNAFKHRLYEQFGLASDRYDGQWEYEQYVRLAEPALEGIGVLLADSDDVCWFIAHEFMGMPTALRAILADDGRYHTAFYAHEVATARKLVEETPGHDAAFYPALDAALEEGRDVGDVFGDQSAFFKHGLIQQAIHCDAILAVGDRVVDELRFLGAGFRGAAIDRVYNGLPLAPPLSAADRKQARHQLAQVARALVGFQPDLVFSHVSRLVASKAMWRDLDVLQAMDEGLRKRRRTAVFFVLATEAGPRLPASTRQMHEAYEWPIVHREGYPDLSPGELSFDLLVRRHNVMARNSRVIFINQFGFDAVSCGGALPEGVGFADLRRGSDAEFGLSIYEPFGIAQIEPLGYGALSVVSDACGCVGFLRQATNRVQQQTLGDTPPVYLVGDYATGKVVGQGADVADMKEREGQISSRVSDAPDGALPGNDRDRQVQLETGHAVAAEMSWEAVVSDQLLPALARATR